MNSQRGVARISSLPVTVVTSRSLSSEILERAGHGSVTSGGRGSWSDCAEPYAAVLVLGERKTSPPHCPHHITSLERRCPQNRSPLHVRPIHPCPVLGRLQIAALTLVGLLVCCSVGIPDHPVQFRLVFLGSFSLVKEGLGFSDFMQRVCCGALPRPR